MFRALNLVFMPERILMRHFILDDQGYSVDKIPLDKLIGPATGSAN